MKPSMWGTIGTIAGILAGIITTWSVMRSEFRTMETDMEAKIKSRVQIETRLKAVEEMAKRNKDDIWTINQSK